MSGEGGCGRRVPVMIGEGVSEDGVSDGVRV